MGAVSHTGMLVTTNNLPDEKFVMHRRSGMTRHLSAIAHQPNGYQGGRVDGWMDERK